MPPLDAMYPGLLGKAWYALILEILIILGFLDFFNFSIPNFEQ